MAYTYTGTPNSKIEAAKARITNDSAVAETALSSYMALANAEQANVATTDEAPTIEESNQEVSGIQRLGETFGDILKNIFVGTQKAIEGLVDFGASTVGVFAGWAGNDELKQNATSFVAKDLTNNWYDHLNADYGIDLSFSNSFINDMSSTGQNIIRGIGQGIGQMLPMVLTGGAGAALKTAGKIGSVGLKAIKAANLVGLGMSAAGTGTEEALNSEVLDENGNKKEVTLDRAFLYGLASGAVEVATETLVGGVYDKAFGKGVADKLISKLAKSPKFGKAVKLALNSLGEGVEEVTSAAVSDTLKTIYNSADGKVHWESPDVQDMFESGVIGTLTAATLGGANIVVRKASNTATVQDTVTELEESERRADALEEKGKLTPELATQMEQQTQDNLAYLSKRFTQAKEKTQTKILQQNPALSKYLNADGTVRTTALAEGATEITAEQAHGGTMSASLATRRNEVANTLASHGTTLAVELDETQTTNKNKLQSILRLSGKSTGAPLRLVVSETMPGENAFVTGDYMVISKDRLSSTKTVAEDLAHETTHFAEGTKEYGDLVDYLYNSLNARQGVREFKLSDGGTMKANTLWQQAVMEVYENSTAGGREGGYKISTETFEKLKEGKLSADEMSDEERLAVSEVVAKASEYVLGEETVINDLVEKNRSLAKKVLTRVKNTIATIEAAFKGDKETLETLRDLRKAEKLYEKALAASGEKFLRGRAIANVLRHQVDSPVNLEYSKRGYQKQDISTVTEKSFSHHAWATNELTGCLAAAEIRAFNDAIGQIKAGTFTPPKTTDGHYILEVGTYKGGERTTIIITDGIYTGPSIDAVYKIYADSAETITTVKGFIYERVTATNDYSSVEEAFRAYADTNEDTGFREYTLGSGSSFEDFDQQRREGRSNKRSSIREQTRNRYSDRVRTNAVDDTQRSLRDSEGRTLSPAQREFFKNSQARDKAGNLLVVYHGTVNEFYAFDRQYAEAEGDWGKGFYFTSTPSDVATNYASEDGADLTNKIARFAENLENQTEYEDLSYEERLKIAKKHFVKGKARTIESYLNVENPARVGENETFLDYNENYDEETGEYADEEPTGLLVDFVEALQNNVDNFESWGFINFWDIIGDLDYYEGVSLSNVAEKLKESVLDTLTTDDGSPAINELIRLALQDMGFDGIIDTTVSKKFRNMKGMTPDTKHIIVFESNQAKLVDNAEPTSNEDIRYSLRTAIEKERQYSREDIESLLGEVILGDNNIFKGLGKYASVKGKKGDILEYMWEKLKKTNGDTRPEAIRSVVDYIVDRLWLQEYYTKGDARNGHTVLNAVREYLGKVNVTEVKSALASREDYKQISSRWANSKSGTVTAAEFVEQVKTAGIRLTSTDTAAALVEINDLYNEAQAAIEAAKKSSGKSLHQTFTEDELKNVKTELTEKLTAALEAGGKPTELSKLMKYYGKVTGELRSALKESKVYNKALNKAIDLAEKLKPNSEKHFRDASHLDDPTFTAVIGQLGKLKYRSDLRKAGARKIFANFGTWYNASNLLLNDNLTVEEARAQLTETGTCGYLNADILQAIEDLTDAVSEKGPLTLEELQKATLIMQAAQAILKGYDMEYLGGEQVRLSEVSAAANATATKFAPMHKKGSWLKQLVRGYGYNIIEPRVVLAEMFGYEDNALTKAYKDITDGETQSMLVRISLLQKLDAFFKENKSYKKRLCKDTITVSGHTLTVNSALQLFMLSQQKASLGGLKEGGWGIRDKKGYWVDCGFLTDGDITELTKQLSNADVAFLKMARNFYDASGQYMYDTDLKLKGYSTIQLEGSDYCPINRYSDDFARTVDESFSLSVMNASVQNLGVTKLRVKNQRKIEVQSITEVMESHAKSIGLYAGLAVPVKAFQRIYNCNLGTTKQVRSVRNTINEQSWKDFNKYVTNLLADIQGISGKTNLGDKIVNKLRGAFATYQLGFNIKSFFSQAAGYPMAFCYLSTSSMIKAFGHGFSTKGVDGKAFKNMDKYCPWAMARHYESGYALAESVEDKLSQVQNVTTQHIRYGDRLITGLIWNACQCEVEKTKGLKYGTVENMEEAGKLLEIVGRGSQGNYVASERSAMQRSSSIIKTFTMFTADNVKQLSRLVEAIGKERAITFREKKLHEVVTKAEKMAAHKYTSKTVTAVLMSNLVYVLMAQMIKHMMDKDHKDKDGNEISVFEDASITYISNLAGMFPILSEVYGVFAQGYDSDNFVYEALNGLVSASRDIYDGAALLASGEAYETRDIVKPLRSLVYALGQVLGIPTRNIYNLFYGIIKRFDESAAYEINSIFAGSAAYSKDLNKALTEGDTELSSTIIGLMLKEDGMTSTSPKVNTRLRELYEHGYKVLPKTIGESISYDGEIYSLSERQQNAFKKVYSDANTDVEKLISSASFLSLNDEVQANAIKWIYDYYYEAAVFQTVGVEPDTKRLLFAETMDVNKFAMATSACTAVEGRKDRSGKTITGSKRAAVLRLLDNLSLSKAERLMVLAYLGYDVDEYVNVIKTYIRKLCLSKAQQEELLKFCGV